MHQGVVWLYGVVERGGGSLQNALHHMVVPKHSGGMSARLGWVGLGQRGARRHLTGASCVLELEMNRPVPTTSGAAGAAFELFATDDSTGV